MPTFLSEKGSGSRPVAPWHWAEPMLLRKYRLVIWILHFGTVNDGNKGMGVVWC